MDGQIAARRLDEIAACSASGEGVTRLPWTPEHKAALDHIRAWMEDAGLAVRLDAAGTLIGRSPGSPEKPALLMGSHQDSVPNGGKYDGIMGVALACLAAKRLKGAWESLPFAVEVLAFADEEGVRFPTALIGPRALAGTLDPGVFDMTDGQGVRMRDAMESFGVTPASALALGRSRASVLGFLETHIEQGPVLEAAGISIGLVTAICGIARFAVSFEGETGHAGTVPMAGRRDALVAAAAAITEINAEAREVANLRATIGRISVKPGAVNAIPSRVDFTLEIRAADDAVRDAFADRSSLLVEAAAKRHDLTSSIHRTYTQRAVPCDPDLSGALAAAADATGYDSLRLMSGATHDASAMADLCPIAMLFIPCRGGVSHRPDEHAQSVDMDAAVDVMAEAISQIARRYEPKATG